MIYYLSNEITNSNEGCNLLDETMESFSKVHSVSLFCSWFPYLK